MNNLGHGFVAVRGCSGKSKIVPDLRAKVLADIDLCEDQCTNGVII